MAVPQSVLAANHLRRKVPQFDADDSSSHEAFCGTFSGRETLAIPPQSYSGALRPDLADMPTELGTLPSPFGGPIGRVSPYVDSATATHGWRWRAVAC
jgi:hypothetical protein